MPKIYTKTGDKGKSSLIGGGRYHKSDPIFDVLGTLDELNSFLSFVPERDLQNFLFELGALIADVNYSSVKWKKVANKTTFLEKEIDKAQKLLPPLKNFILPKGCGEACHYHVARSVARRLERICVMHCNLNGLSYCEVLQCFVNRLSDYLFVKARLANLNYGVDDVIWKSSV